MLRRRHWGHSGAGRSEVQVSWHGAQTPALGTQCRACRSEAQVSWHGAQTRALGTQGSQQVWGAGQLAPRPWMLLAELGIPNDIRHFGTTGGTLSTEIPNAISVAIPIPNGWYRMTFLVSLNFPRRQRIFITYMSDMGIRHHTNNAWQVLPLSVRNCS